MLPVWLARLLRRRFDDEDLQAEIKAHLALATAEKIADGQDHRAARQASLREFGNVTLAREAAHHVWLPRWVDIARNAVDDVRFALRSLRKHPGFAVTVLGVLTIGIGLNAAVFTMLKSMAISPLAGVPNSARMTMIGGETSTGRSVRISYPDYLALRARQSSLTDIMGSSVVTATLGRGRGARPAWAEVVTGNYFDVLGVKAGLGRLLQPDDERSPGGSPVVVLSDGLWRREFGADPAIAGKTITVNNTVLTVVGVAAPGFHGTIVSYDIEFFLPVMMAPTMGFTFGAPADRSPAGIFADNQIGVLYLMGWLRPGVTMAQASAEIATHWTALSAGRPLDATTARLVLTPFWRAPVGAQSVVLPMLLALSVMGLLVLVIACANIAGLVVVRGLSRRGEIAVRLALGAGRARIVRLLLAENLVLALPSAAVGVALAARGIPWLMSYAETLAAPQRVFLNLETDWLVIGFAAGVAVVCVLIFGFLPALQSTRVDVGAVIKDEGPRTVGRGRFRSGLVLVQVAVSVTLLVGTGLVTRSLEAAQVADRGYVSRDVTAADLDLKANGYTAEAGRQFYGRLLDRLRASPGVTAASLALYTPLMFLDTRVQPVTIEGYETQRGEDLSLMSNVVTPDYFRTLSVPVIAGREFSEHDDASREPVAMVNRTLAERFWGSAEAAIGKRVRTEDGVWHSVVGVAADLKYIRVNDPPRPYLYLSFLQNYRPAMVVHTRGASDATALVDQVRAAVAALDPELPPVKVRSLDEATRGAFLFYRFMALMLLIFGAAGMALAGLGTYGLVSYGVQQGTREIGIRLALGASGPSVVRAFVWRGLRVGTVGAVFGSLAALAVGRLMGNVLYGVGAADGRSFLVAVAVVLTGVALATIVPAWRASRTNPLTVLRRE